MIDWGTRSLMLLALAAVALTFHLLARPRLGRLALVRAPNRSRPRRRASRRIRVVNMMSTGIATALILGKSTTGSIAAAALLGAAIVPATWIGGELIVAQRTGAPLRRSSRFRVRLDPPPSLLSRLSPRRQLLAAAALVLPAVVLWRWNAGDPGPWTFFVPLLVFLDALLLLVAALEVRQRPALPPAAEEGYAALREDKVRVTVRILESAMIAWNIAGGLMWLAVAFDTTGPGHVVAVAAVALAGPLLLLWVARDVGRLLVIADAMDVSAGGPGLGTHLQGWRWGGLLYYAPDDPALAVPAPSGLGHKLNLARHRARLLLTTVVAFPVVLGVVALCG